MVVTVVDDTEQVLVEVRWIGGHTTRTTLIRPVARMAQLSRYRALLKRVKALQSQGDNAVEIARTLNAEGWRPPKRRDTYNASMVRSLLSRQGLGTGTDKQQHTAGIERQPDEWTLKELAGKLDMPEQTLYSWLRKGVLKTRRTRVATRSIWLVQADQKGLDRLRTLRTSKRLWAKITEGTERNEHKHS